ncbi:MAG: asnB [Flaviaesturariibacter sp.]|nr:asnB [Flaviaesturariibacter sp.]
MCGIAGIVSDKKSSDLAARIDNAINAINHRGPEHHQHWINAADTALLGHCRLSIIDLSDRSRQPFTYIDRYTITYNGELYNYPEIKNELEQKGYGFRTTSDTEVVIAAYAAWGKNCLQRFDGAFAFAIWDNQEEVLFAARDRFGEKPFFFTVKDDSILFASELKALWILGAEKEVNPAMLYNFLTLGYVVNPADSKETFYKDIYKLPAASFLVFKNGETTIETYWTLGTATNGSISEKDAIEKFTHLFAASVARRLRSDVPIGTSLSGGLDSSTVVAFCQQAAGAYTHQSFTATFPGFEKDEAKLAALVSKQFGLQAHFISVEAGEVVSLMQQVMAYQEEPIGSASPLAQYKVFQAAKAAGVTVLLDGQGADEILAGYGKYYRWYWRELYAKKQLAKSGELAAAKSLERTEGFGLMDKLAALLPHFAASLQQAKQEKAAYRNPVLNPDFAFVQKRNSYYSLPTEISLNGILHYNTINNGLEELLRMADRNSMAHAVEVRLPFLNHELVEFLFSLPPHLKIHKGWTKWLLRKAAEPLLPADIVWRRDKTGFEPPQKAWMGSPAVQEAIQAGKDKLVSNGILRASALRQKIKPHTAYAANSMDWRLWSASFLF